MCISSVFLLVTLCISARDIYFFSWLCLFLRASLDVIWSAISSRYCVISCFCDVKWPRYFWTRLPYFWTRLPYFWARRAPLPQGCLENLCHRGIGIFSANAYASHTLVPTRVALPTEPWLFYAFLTWGLDFKLAKFSIFVRIDKCTHDGPSILLIPNIAWHVYCTHCFSQVFFDLCFAFKLWWFFGQCSCPFPSLPEQHCPSFPTPLSWCGRAPPGWQLGIKMT